MSSYKCKYFAPLVVSSVGVASTLLAGPLYDQVSVPF